MLKTAYESVNPSVVFEEYYGRTPNLIKAEKALDKIAAKIRACETKLQLYKLNINESKENEEVCKAFEKEFGFKKMNLYWSNESVPNAYTVMGSVLTDPTPDMEHTRDDLRVKNKYYDHSHHHVCVVNVIMNFVRKVELTGAELLGVILHEIGHNFDAGFSMQFERLFAFMSNPVYEILANTIFKYVKLPGEAAIQNIAPALSKLISLKSDLLYNINLVPGSIIDILNALSSHPEKITMLLFGGAMYMTEYNADAFPASYGYGVTYSQAMDKMSDPTRMKGFAKSIVYRIPVLRVLYDVQEGMVNLLVQGLFDPHPFDENRILAIRKKLEKDYHDPGVPKSLKPEIKKQIEAVDKIYKQNVEETGDGLVMTRMRKYIMRAIFDRK